MGKIERSWELTKASMAVLRADKELLVFPIVSAITVILVALTFVLPLFGFGLLDRQAGAGAPPLFYLWAFAFYLTLYFIIFFFNSALVGAAMMRLDGADPTVADGLRIARSKWLPILGYAAIAATVGLVLRAMEQRAGFIGRIVVGIIGVAWTLSTFLAVPVLVARDIGPMDAVKESAALLKKTWGESLIGNGGLGLVLGLATVAVIAAGAAMAMFLMNHAMGGLAIAAAIVTGVAVLAMSLVQSALSGIYSAALYRFAVGGQAPAGFDGLLLRNAFQRKV